MRSYIYLASPYSSDIPQVREKRYIEVMEITAELMKKGFHVFSPIVHCHQIAEAFGLPKEIEYWREYDRMMLRQAALLMVCRMNGWQESEGVQYEIRCAIEFEIPIAYLDPGLRRAKVEVAHHPV